LTVVPDLGGKVAAAIVKERKKGEFSSVEDLAKRTKINKNVVEFITERKIIKDMPASDQAVLF
jgi:DNA polymerase-3 subunit alpha (Gram-positive type)